MKKNGKCECARPATPAACESGQREAGENSRNRKTYESRLEELGLTKPPVASVAKAPSQMELAQLAATLSRDGVGYVGAVDVVGKALEIWNAAGRAVFVEEVAAYIVRGIFVFDRADWERHCRMLIGLLDEAAGAIPGRNSSEDVRESEKQARLRAAEAVAHIWRQRGRGGDVGRLLFPAKSETEESRAKKLVALIEFAKKRVEECDELGWRAKDGNRLKACLRHAWDPLGMPEEDGKFVDAAAEIWLAMPSTIKLSNVGASPVLARWLALLRMEQNAEAKSRA